MIFFAKYHRPHLCRYRVADPGLRLALNRSCGVTLGLALVTGRYAYCVKWADAAARIDLWPVPGSTATREDRA